MRRSLGMLLAGCVAVEEVRACLREAREQPPSPYFWPDGAYDTLDKVDDLLALKEPAN